jgi:hypothetical protein
MTSPKKIKNITILITFTTFLIILMIQISAFLKILKKCSILALKIILNGKFTEFTGR